RRSRCAWISSPSSASRWRCRNHPRTRDAATRMKVGTLLFQKTADHCDRTRPTLGFGGELFPAGASDRVELGAAVVLAGAPLARNPSFLLEPQERRINRALVERERSLCDLLDAPGDGVSVQRPH